MSIRNSVDDFLDSDQPAAIVISGKWGRGKTHFWNSIVTERLRSKSVRVRKYSYVSLFGISSIEELKASIFQASAAWDFEQRGIARRVVNPRMWWHGLKIFLGIATRNASAPYVGNVSRLYTSLTFYSVRERLICIDDIERRGKDLRLLDVMGLVSQLWEQRACKVVVILNNETFESPDQTIWRANAEKVFLREMAYEPLPDECIGYVFPNDNVDIYSQAARKYLVSLSVTNIRIAERTKSAIQSIKELIAADKILNSTVDRLVQTLVLLVYSHNGEGEGAPPLSVVVGRGRADSIIRASRGNQPDIRTEEQKRWDRELSGYGLYLDGDLDASLIDLVVKGYPDGERLQKAIAQFDDSNEAQAARDAYFEAWELFHDTLGDNREEVLNAFLIAFPSAAPMVSANNLDATVRLLREMGEDKIATKFIETWIAAGNRSGTLEMDRRYVEEFGPLHDPELLAALENYQKGHERLPSLEDSMRALGKDGSWDEKIVKAIAICRTEDMTEYLTKTKARWLTKAVERCLQFGASQPGYPYDEARNTVETALVEISARSSFSALRVKWRFDSFRRSALEEKHDGEGNNESGAG